MRGLLRAFTRTLVAVATLVGILYLPADIAGLPNAIRWPWTIPVSIGRETLVLGYAVVLTAWLAWSDARPFIRSWLRARREPPLRLEYPNEINSPGKYGEQKRSIIYTAMDRTEAPVMLKRVTYFVGVTNTTPRTIKNVSLKVVELRNPLDLLHGGLLMRQPDGVTHIDIRPGDTEIFLIGFRHDTGPMIAESHVFVPGIEIDKMLDEAPPPHDFRVVSRESRAIGLLRNNGSTMVLGLYAEDLPEQRHHFTFNFTPVFELRHNGPA